MIDLPPGQPEAALRDVDDACALLRQLAERNPDLASALARSVGAVAGEALRTARFSKMLLAAFEPKVSSAATVTRQPHGRRQPGPIDPFTIYATDGESALRAVLGGLDLEQLRDIIAEHGMDHDRLAMKWKTDSRVIDRIVEKVATRSSKGSAFRSSD